MSEQLTQYKNAVGELKDMIAGYGADLTNLKDESSEFKSHYEKLNEKLDSLELEMKKAAPKPSPEAVKSAQTAAFQKMAVDFASKKGERSSLADRYKEVITDSYHKSLKGETKSDNLVRFDYAGAGALLLPEVIQQEIIRDVVESTPVLEVARVTTIGAEALKRRIRTSTPGGRWLEEEAENVKGKPKYKTKRIPLHKWASYYGVTIEQEQDAAYNMIEEMMIAFREDFAVDFGDAFLNGGGNGKPTGVVGRVDSVPSESLALTADLLIKLQEELKGPYQANAAWMMTRQTRGYVRTIIFAAGNDVNGAWEPDLTRRTPTLLLGAPVVLAAPGDLAGQFKGDFTAGEVPIIYGDWSQGYEVAMGSQMYMIDDPYSEAASFVRNLHIMNRVGGDVIKPEALKQLTITSS